MKCQKNKTKDTTEAEGHIRHGCSRCLHLSPSRRNSLRLDFAFGPMLVPAKHHCFSQTNFNTQNLA